MMKKEKQWNIVDASGNNGKRVLVIGGDHGNTLASVRALSEFGIVYDLIIHDARSKRTLVGSSKFAPKPLVVDSSYEAIENAIRVWIGNHSPSSCVVLPSSDLSALVVDECFKEIGVLASGFSGGRWRISDLMDKGVQAKWASAQGLRVAEGREFVLDDSSSIPPIDYPLIVKPVLSAEGEKSDIVICRGQNDYSRTLNYYVKSGYKRILVQELVEYDYEIVCMGVIRLNGSFVWRAYAKDVVYPAGCGSTAFAHLETNEVVLTEIVQVLQSLSEEGYRGIFDIDFFVLSDSLMLNEINFRQSGIVAFPFCEGLYLPSLWAQELIGTSTGESENRAFAASAGYAAIVEDGFLYYAKDSGEGVSGWCRAILSADGKSLLYPGDKAPFWFFVGRTLINQGRKTIAKLRKKISSHGHIA